MAIFNSELLVITKRVSSSYADTMNFSGSEQSWTQVPKNCRPEDIAKHAVRTVIQTLNAQALVTLVVGNRHFDLTFGNGWNSNHF